MHRKNLLRSSILGLNLINYSVFVVCYALMIYFSISKNDLQPPLYQFDIECEQNYSSIIHQYATNISYVVDQTIYNQGCQYHWFPELHYVCSQYDNNNKCTQSGFVSTGQAKYNHPWERW